MSLYEQFQADQANKSITAPSGTSDGGGSLYDKFLADQKPKSPVAPETSLVDKAITGVKNYANESEQSVYDTGNAILHPMETADKVFKLFSGELKAGIDKASGKDTVYGSSNAANVTADVANLISGTAQALFSPISGAFKVASHIPGAKQAADVINLPFAGLGFAASFASGKAIDWIPDSVMSPETKNIIKQPIQDTAALAAQVLLGGKIMDKISTVAKKGEPITPEVAKQAVIEAQAEIHKIPVKTAAEKYQEYLDRNRYEPYVPNNMLPTIEMGATPKDVLPTIQTESGAPSTGSYKYISTEPKYNPFIQTLTDRFNSETLPVADHPANKASVVEPIKAEPSTVAPVKFIESAPKAPISPVTETAPIVGDGATKVRSLAQGVEAKAIEKNLTQGFGDLPEYQSVSMKDQAMKAADILNKDFEQAKRIALGHEAAPTGVIPESVFIAVEDRAIKTGDVNTLRDLATKSKLATEATSMGQRIRTLAERDTESPTGAITDIIKAREEAFKKRAKVKSVEIEKNKVSREIQKEIKKAKPTKEDWNSFVRSLEC